MSNPNAPQRNRPLRIALVSLAVLVVAGLGTWLWIEVLKDRLIPKRWGEVVEGRLYRCGRLHPSLIDRMIEKHDVGLVIDLTENEPGDPSQDAEKEAVERLGIERLHLPLDPMTSRGADDAEEYARAIAAIVEANRESRAAMIHCEAGVQRTGVAVAFYRILIQGWSPERAYREMLEYKWDPIDDYILIRYANRNLPETARLLVEKGVLDKPPAPMPEFAQPEKAGEPAPY